jgi:hypothetical protein
MDNKNLLKYKGWKCNIMTIKTIECEFHPYRVMICDFKQFNNEIYLHNTIRCFINEYIIIDLKFN